MKIMTFNIQHGLLYKKDRIDLDVFAEAINRENPDILALNEVRGEGEHPNYTAQAQILAEKTKMNYFFAPAIVFENIGPYGIALLSKQKIENPRIIRIPAPDYPCEPRVILKASVGGITVMLSHFGLTEAEHKNAVSAVLENLEQSKCVFMGDLNMTPDNAILAPLFEKLFDTAAFCPNKLSFPSDIPEIKIDYIFVTRDIKPISADIPDTVVSDHRYHYCII